VEVNKLYQGDCLPFLESLPTESIDALITDPPYASGGLHIGAKQASTTTKYMQTSTKREFHDFAGDHRDQRSHLRWSMMWLSECWRLLKPGAPVCLFTDWRQLPTTTDALQAAGFSWRGIAVWDKTEGTRPVLGRFRAQCEYIVWGSKGNMPTDRGVGVLPGVIRQVVKTADKHHITGKPLEVMRQVNRICVPSGIILDPFAGSGSTLVAAAMDGYQWLGCELSQHYREVAEARLQAARFSGAVSANLELVLN
jgi:site-specific DNA-methyltransferase (adenine-specific)